MERGIRAEDILLKTSVRGMDLLPSNIDLSAAEIQLVSEVAREHALSRALLDLSAVLEDPRHRGLRDARDPRDVAARGGHAVSVAGRSRDKGSA